jgi:hypothetical protein
MNLKCTGFSCTMPSNSSFNVPSVSNDEDLKLTQVCRIENPRLKKFRLSFSGSSLQKKTLDLFENLLHWMQVVISCDWLYRKRFSELFRANPHPPLQACPATTRGLYSPSIHRNPHPSSTASIYRNDYQVAY